MKLEFSPHIFEKCWYIKLHENMFSGSRIVAWGRSDRHTDMMEIQGGSNMTGTDLCVNKPHCAAAVRP